MTKRLWTEEEEQYLLDNYMDSTILELSSYLNRTPKSIENKSSRLGLKKKRDWTPEEDSFMRDNYGTLGMKGCATILNRSISSINNRANRLEVKSHARTDSEYLNHQEWLKSVPNFLQLEEYRGNKSKILFKHLKCNYKWYTSPANIKNSIRLGNVGCPFCNKSNPSYSKIAIRWLTSLNNTSILHAENGGEQTVAGYKVDGYDPITNTVYEFHGDVYHGNLNLFKPDFNCHPFNRLITAEELWQKTFDRMNELAKVATVIYIWEDDYLNGRSYSIFNEG